MKLPEVLEQLIVAGNNQDSAKYADFFSEDAQVYDEGKNHTGQKSIKEWIAEANEKYNAKTEPISYTSNSGEDVMEARVSGNFEGSPIVLKYHLRINNGKIDYLKITG
ncbi:MAG: nuclear transport factor 2 family protein [Chitinophagaceae bacterium]|jgi:hypothetical protein